MQFKIWRILLLFLTILVFTSSLYSQQEQSIHKLHKELYGKEVPAVSKLHKYTDIIPLNISKTNELSAAVFGYLPDWEYAAGTHQYLRYDLLTHIACFDFSVDKYGNVGNPANWPWTDLINEAHSNGVKIILTAVKFGSSSDSRADMHHLLTDSSAIENFYSQIIGKMKTYNMDGVNIDFETYAAADEGAVTTNFMRGLAERVRAEIPGAEISFASPIINWGDDYQLFEMASFLDYMFIMGYAFHGPWSSTSGPGSPLNTISDALYDDYNSIIQTMPEKLILGVPYYGLFWRTNSAYPYASVKPYSSSDPDPDWRGNLWFSDIVPELTVDYENKWDTQSSTPWILIEENDVLYQTWYDNATSLGLKYELATSNGFKGVGMWALGYDGPRPELWNLIDSKYGSGELPPPIKPAEFMVTINDEASLALYCTTPEDTDGFEVLISSDGKNFDSYGLEFTNSMTASELNSDSVSYLKVNAFNSAGASANTEVLAGIPNNTRNNILVVNGFDRTSGTSNTFDYIKEYAKPLLINGYKFSSASNEAVFRGSIDILEYETVIWILGDESADNSTFNSFEQEIVTAFLKNGGNLLVTGAEIGWDLVAKGETADQTFYETFLKASYITDAPSNNAGTYYTAEGLAGTIFDGLELFSFDNGSHGTFDVDWPDAIEGVGGAENILKFGTVSTSAGYAGISYSGIFGDAMLPGKLVHLSIPLETIYPVEVRTDIISRVLEFFEDPSAVDETIELHPDEFKLVGNYPNPFNPSTTISFKSGSAADYTLQVFDMLGQLVTTTQGEAGIGSNNINWNAHKSNGNQLTSGTYIYRISIESASKVLTGKMMLLR